MKRTLAQFAAACGGTLHGLDTAFAGAGIDTRKLRPGELFFALPGTRVDGHDFVAAAAVAGAAGAVVSRRVDVALPQVLVADVAQALTTGARAWRAGFHGPLVGVAGSNGKTTTKEMLAAILAQGGACLATRGNLNNQLGVPLTLLGLTEQHHSAVIEMGANRAGDVAELVAIATPGIGLITNAGAEHLEGFGTLEGVARAEGEMVAGLPGNGVAVVNADDPFAPLWRSLTSARVVAFGLGADAEVRATDVRHEVTVRGFVTRFTLRAGAGAAAGSVDVELALAGAHNVHNALAAAAAALAAGATLAEVAAGLASMQAVDGRLQFRAVAGDVWLIDDSYNANPSSVQAALEVLAALPGRRWLVLGDMAELGPQGAALHREVGALARRLGIERLYSFGELAALAAESFGAGAERHRDMGALTQALRTALGPGVRLLIKGSRVNRLERLVMALSGTPAARPAGRTG